MHEVFITMKNTTKSFQEQLQNKILLFCNLIVILFLIPLGIISFMDGQMPFIIITAVAFIFLSISLILQKLNFYPIASYITMLILSAAAFFTTYSRTVVIPELPYLFISYQMIPLVLAGLLAQNRFVALFMGFLSLSLLTFYVFVIQKSAIGLEHTTTIAGVYLSTIILTLLSDQIYKLTGNMMVKFNEEMEISNNKDVLLKKIIDIYQANQQSGEQLDVFNIDTDTVAGQLNENMQKFTSDLYEFNQLVKDIQIRNENLVSSSSNILSVFNNHKENIVEYKNKTHNISETSQEINLIIQDRKVQMNELIELSEKGGIDMQESVFAIEKVAENSKNILDMIALIMEVAEKTNILALNAAVEASRAGKYGGGFAIVAKEIKLLSTETTQNADTINQSLQSNIKSITETVEIIRNVGKSFSQLNTNIIDFSTAIDQIVVKIFNLTQENSHMSIETKNTLSLIGEVQNILEKTINSIQTNQLKVTDMNTLAEVLEKDVSQVTQTTNAIINSGRDAQKKYREYKYSVKKVEDTITEIDQQHII